MITSPSAAGRQRPPRQARRGRRWAGCVATAAAVSLLSACALLPLPGALSDDRAAAPASPAAPDPTSSSTSSEPSTPTQAPSAPSANRSSAPDAAARAQTVLASVGADAWPRSYTYLLSQLPDGIDEDTAVKAGETLQAWTLASVITPSVLQADSPQAARTAYLQTIPDGVYEHVQQYLANTPDSEPSVNWSLMNTLDTDVELLANPAINAAYYADTVGGGPYEGDLRLNASVVAVYAVTYQGRDYAVPVHRLLSIDVPPGADTVDDVFEQPVQWITACAPQDDGVMSPDVSVPADLLKQGVDRMVHNGPILAESRLADPLQETDLLPVSRLVCD